MKSLDDMYTSTHGSTHETFADLIFCALIVLVLFIMALAIEVSQRVRAELNEIEPIEVVQEEELVTMTKEEVEALSQKLQAQQELLEELQQQLHERDNELAQQEQKVADQMAAISGEQRFTGAREPAAIHLAYDYKEDRYYFVPSKDVDHADRRKSGETAWEYMNRKARELTAVAALAKTQRGFTQNETQAIFTAFSKYRQIIPTADDYEVKISKLNVYYHITLCSYIAGDEDTSALERSLIELKIHQAASVAGPDSESMYPKCMLEVLPGEKRLRLNGIEMSTRDMKTVLLSLAGRGAMLDLEGFTGKAPEWLKEELLTPTGYISKIPKLPGQ